jgi:hypothetical protein
MKISEKTVRRIIKEEIEKLLEGEITGKRESYVAEPDGYSVGTQSRIDVIPDADPGGVLDAAQGEALHADAEDEQLDDDHEEGIVTLPESWKIIAFGR